jgi:hypothetical protein
MRRGKYRFHEVNRAPDTSGIYAWYCRYDLPQKNIDDLLQLLTTSQNETKEQIVRAFLDRYLFSYFQEQPYEVTLKAPLKPRYEGTVPHIPSISSTLLQRFVEDPQRIDVLANILRLAAPEFSSPIYIGSAKSLRRRLESHERLIRKYREGQLSDYYATNVEELPAEERADHSFAREAAINRRLDPNDLWAHTLEVDLGHEYTFDIENILNRINFPLCGRN